MKTCCKCKIEKDESEFYYKKSENRYESMCKSCLHSYQINRWIQRKKEAITYKGGCCSICGYDKYYGALEFHHTDPNTKEFDWSKLRLHSLNRIKTELDKCILVCSNCHRELHSTIH